jgi:acyl-CoA synthetase (AMP-forming)/AMP-acid ligase II
MAAVFDYGEHGLPEPKLRPAIPDLSQSVAAVLDPVLSLEPDREALVDRHSRYTYRELDLLVNRAAHAIAALGVTPFERVAMSLGNYADLVIVFLATMRLGAIWVGISRSLAPREKAYILRDSGARVLLSDPGTIALIESERSSGELPALLHALAIEPGNAHSTWARMIDASRSTDRPDLEIDPFAPAAIAYTSGTTGFPKGAVHSQHNILMPGVVSRVRQEFPSEMRHGCVLPITILNLMVLGPVLAFQNGSCVVPIDTIDALGLAEFIHKERIGHFAGVPTILYDLLTHPQVEREDLRTLVRPLVGGAECPEALRKEYRERFGCDVTIGYGMTEAPTAVTMTDGKSPLLPGLCGSALPHVDIHIVDESDRELGVNEVGEICVAPAGSGPLASVYTPMLGYWRQPDATAKALERGWFHTGDLGLVDEQGRLFIRGRRNDLILRGGANVYPAEVERVLMEDARVAACAVIGRPDARLGERVVAAIELKPGANAGAEELQEYCRKALARYKVPEEIVFVEAFPRNAMGKIVKHELKKAMEKGTVTAQPSEDHEPA